MPINYFHGRSKTSLEADLVAAQNELAKGKQRQSVNTPDLSVSYQPDMTLKRRIREILLALNKLDPVTYPDADTIPVTSAEAQFTRTTTV